MPRLRIRCGDLVYDRSGLLGSIAGPLDRPRTQGLIHHAACISVIQGPGFWKSQELPVDYYLGSPAIPAIET